MLMTTKLHELGDATSGANLQMEGHMDEPSQSAEDQQESEALGSFLSHLPSWPWPGGHCQAPLILDIASKDM